MSIQRKKDHIDICLNRDVGCEYDYWEDVNLIHHALPDFDLSEVDSSVELFGKRLSAPIIISAITGGHQDAAEINRNLAEGAARKGVAMGVGSQRAALESDEYRPGYEVIRDYDVPLVIGNIGAPQLISQNGKKAFGPNECQDALSMINGDILAVHLNFTQELVQPEGDTKARGCIEALGTLCRNFPILAKETGAGISGSVAVTLRDTGVIGLDVGGKGGTSFSAVEYYRSMAGKNDIQARLGKTFRDWGIPTPVSILACDVGLPLIATGGLRTGLDIAKAIALGASAGGVARGLLNAAVTSAEAVERELETLIIELKGAMFLTGAQTIAELAESPYFITGKTAQWQNNVRKHRLPE